MVAETLVAAHSAEQQGWNFLLNDIDDEDLPKPIGLGNSGSNTVDTSTAGADHAVDGDAADEPQFVGRLFGSTLFLLFFCNRFMVAVTQLPLPYCKPYSLTVLQPYLTCSLQ